MSLNIETDRIQVKQIKNEEKSKIIYNFCSDKYSVLYIMDGVSKCTVEGSVLALSNSSALILRPATYCMLESGEEEFNAFVLDFCVEDLAGDAPNKLKDLSKCDAGMFAMHKHTGDSFRMLIDQLDIVSVMPEEQKRSYLELLISQMIVLLCASSDGRQAEPSIELGARVIEYLNENAICDNVSLDDLARRFFVSKYYLCRAFKKYNGISVHGYINRKRITYAKQLIDSGETASGAAYKVGYGDYSAFYRAYVKIVGKSPTEQ